MAAIERGYMQSEIQEAAYQYQQAVEHREQIVVGVNQFEVEEQLDLDQLKVDPADREPASVPVWLPSGREGIRNRLQNC